MNRDLNIKSTIRQILGVLISIMILINTPDSCRIDSYHDTNAIYGILSNRHNHHRLRKRYNRHKRQRISLGPQQQDTGS